MSDSARSGVIDHSESTYIEIAVAGSGDIRFYWRVSSQNYSDKLRFHIDGSQQWPTIDGEDDWAYRSYSVDGNDTHTLKWAYTKNASVSDGNDCGWVDYVQWTGDAPAEPNTTEPNETGPQEAQIVTYTYDPSGRRIAKTIGSTTTKYVYDGAQVIAEYEGSSALRKYIYGPGIDQAHSTTLRAGSVCMVEADTNDLTYDTATVTGSVIALSDEDGDTVETYEYSVYGRVQSSGNGHANPYLFTGRRLDPEIAGGSSR